MLKTLLIFFFGLLIFQGAIAQQTKAQGMHAYYLDGNGLLSNKNDAVYIMIILPADSSSGKKLYQVNKYYKNGKRMQTGASTTNTYDSLKYDGAVISYYTNGARKTIMSYNNGELIDNVVLYYPDGNPYAMEKYNPILNSKTYNYKKIDLYKDIKRIECRDSTGKELASGGNGQWIEMDDSCKTILTEGTVKDSLADGEWHGMDGDRVACVNIYKRGTFISGIYYNKTGKKYPYSTPDVNVTFYNGWSDFEDFVNKSINYPAGAISNKIQGVVTVSFFIEKDGTVSEVKSIKAPSDDLAAEAIRVIKLSSWVPTIHNGYPTRTKCIQSIDFDLPYIPAKKEVY